MDFSYTEEQKSIFEMCTQFANTEIAPMVRELERAEKFPIEIFKKLADLGVLTMCVPENAGGSFLDTASYVLALRAISKADAGITVGISVTNMVAEAIFRNGSEAQIKKYIPKIASGEMIVASFALTEGHAGSDPGNLRTTAKKDGDHYILNGEKIFISHGDMAGVTIVMAKTDATKGSKGISAFLVDKGTPGFSVGKKEEKLGLLSSSTVSLVLDNCKVHKSQLLGELGGGFKIALGSLDSGRIGISAQAIGIAEAAYEAALKYAKERIQFGKPIAEHQVISFKLADMKTRLNAAKLLAMNAAWLKDEKKPFTEEASMSKVFSTEMCNYVTAEAFQIHGGYGYIKEYLVEKYLRDARVTTIYEGTSEIQRIVIARNILA